MWVKCQNGNLVNLDHAVSIKVQEYSPQENVKLSNVQIKTVDDKYYILSEYRGESSKQFAQQDLDTLTAFIAQIGNNNFYSGFGLADKLADKNIYTSL